MLILCLLLAESEGDDENEYDSSSSDDEEDFSDDINDATKQLSSQQHKIGQRNRKESLPHQLANSSGTNTDSGFMETSSLCCSNGESSSGDSDGGLQKRKGDPCAICLGSLHAPIGCPERCDHSFCLDCILEWAKVSLV